MKKTASKSVAKLPNIQPVISVLLLSVLAVLIFLLIYLNRSYAHFFDYIGLKHLPNPNTQPYYSVEAVGYPLRKLTYLAIGDSLTAGVGASNYQYSYPYLLSQELAETGIEIENYNAGIPGATINDITTADQLDYYQRLKPQLITVMIGINDALNRVDLNHFSDRYRQLIKELKSISPEVYIVNIPYLASPKLLNQPYPPLLDWQIQQYNLQIALISQDQNIPMINLYKATKNQFSVHSELYSEDLFHPSDQGYLLWSKIIAPEIKF